jgi:hypothetical protein
MQQKKCYHAKVFSVDYELNKYTWENAKEDFKKLLNIWKDLPPDIKLLFEETLDEPKKELNNEFDRYKNNNRFNFFFSEISYAIGFVSSIFTPFFLSRFTYFNLTPILMLACKELSYICGYSANKLCLSSLSIIDSNINFVLKELANFALLPFEIAARALHVGFNILSMPLDVVIAINATWANDICKNMTDENETNLLKKACKIFFATCLTGILKGIVNGTLVLVTESIHIAKSTLSIPLSIVRRPILAFKKAFKEKTSRTLPSVHALNAT